MSSKIEQFNDGITIFFADHNPKVDLIRRTIFFGSKQLASSEQPSQSKMPWSRYQILSSPNPEILLHSSTKEACSCVLINLTISSSHLFSYQAMVVAILVMTSFLRLSTLLLNPYAPFHGSCSGCTEGIPRARTNN